MKTLTHSTNNLPEDILHQDSFYVGLAVGVVVTSSLFIRYPKEAPHKAQKIFTMLEQGLSLWQQFLTDDPGGSDE